MLVAQQINDDMSLPSAAQQLGPTCLSTLGYRTLVPKHQISISCHCTNNCNYIRHRHNAQIRYSWRSSLSEPLCHHNYHTKQNVLIPVNLTLWMNQTISYDLAWGFLFGSSNRRHIAAHDSAISTEITHKILLFTTYLSAKLRLGESHFYNT